MSSTTAASASNTVDHEDGGFACSICLRDSPASPVLTCCGHVFCWPCIYRWLKGKRPSASLCPVCKGSLSLPPASSSSSSSSPDFTPIYVSSSSSSAAAYGDHNNPSDVHQLDLDGIPIPPRPPAQRKHPIQQAQPLAAAQEHQPQPIMQQQRRTAAHNRQQQQVDQQQPRLIPEPVMYVDDHPQLMRLLAGQQQYSLAEPNFTSNIDDPARLQPQIFYDHWNSQPSVGIGAPALPPPAAAHNLHDQLYLLGGQQYYLNPSANQQYDPAAQYYIGAGAVPPPPPPPPPPPAAAIAMRTHLLGAYSASSAPAYYYTAAAAATGGAAHEYMSSAAVNQLLAAEYLYAGYAEATGSLNHI